MTRRVCDQEGHFTAEQLGPGGQAEIDRLMAVGYVKQAGTVRGGGKLYLYNTAKVSKDARESLKRMIRETGADNAEKLFRIWRSEWKYLKESSQPAPMWMLDRMIAARDALANLKGIGYQYDVARGIDFEVHDRIRKERS